MQVQGLKELLHGDLSPVKFVHNALSIYAVRPLDEAQQMLLVHAGGSVDVGVHLEWQRDDREWITRVWGLGGVITLLGHKRELKTHTRCMAAVSEENCRLKWKMECLKFCIIS